METEDTIPKNQSGKSEGSDDEDLDFSTGLESNEIGYIYNTLGQILQSFTLPKGSKLKQLNIQGLPRGSFYVSIGSHSEKFIKY